MPESYALDHGVGKAEATGDTITLTGAVETETSLEKQIIGKMSTNGQVSVTHRLRTPELRRGNWRLGR